MSSEARAPLSGEAPQRRDVFSIFAQIARQAGPNMIGATSSFFLESVNAMLIGHVGGRHALAAVGLGNMMQNCFGLSIGMGICSAIDTLASQAHGAGKHRAAVLVYQRAMVISSLQMVWILPVMFLSESWLVAIGQDPTVAKLAGEYNKTAVFFLIPYFLSTGLRRLLSAFLRPRGAAMVGIITAVLHIFWATLFVYVLKLGNAGLGLANGVSWTTRTVLLLLYACYHAPDMGIRRRWLFTLEKEAFREWRDFMKVAFPALLQTCGEWWFFEICALLVGYFGPVALAAHTSTMNAVTLCFMVPLAISSAGSALVGNALGSGQPALARMTSWAVPAFSFLSWGLVFAPVLSLGRSWVAAAYTHDQDVKTLMMTLLCIYAVVGCFDSTQTVMGGVCRGLGKMQASSAIYLTAFYAVMLPAALLFAFPLKGGVVGLWWAMGTGTAAAAVSFTVLIHRCDFEDISAKVIEKLEAMKAPSPSQSPTAANGVPTDVSMSTFGPSVREEVEGGMQSA